MKIILSTCLLLFLCSPVYAACSGTLQDSYTSVNSTQEVFSNINRTLHGYGTSFTAGSSYTITCVELKLKKSGSPTGNLKVSIYAQSSDLPSGGALIASSAFDMSTLTTTSAVVSFTLGAGTALTSGTKYVIALELSGAGQTFDGSNNVNVSIENPGNYASGTAIAKSNTDSWGVESGIDAYFATYNSPRRRIFYTTVD